MRFALDSSGNRVFAEISIETEEYFCPVCGEKVKCKAASSKCVRAYFSHLRNSNCTDEWHSDMSEWHYSWQERFPIDCREVVLEKDGEKHRADVLIKDTVIEFQHSPISEEEFLARNKFYLGCGKQLIWIFDMTGKIRLDTEFCTNAVKLKRIRPYLLGYKEEHGYSVFFQDNDKLFWIMCEEYGEFPYAFYPEKTQDAFLKEFGCCDKNDVKSLSEWQQEAKAKEALAQRLKAEREKELQRQINNAVLNMRMKNTRYRRGRRF